MSRTKGVQFSGVRIAMRIFPDPLQNGDKPRGEGEYLGGSGHRSNARRDTNLEGDSHKIHVKRNG